LYDFNRSAGVNNEANCDCSGYSISASVNKAMQHSEKERRLPPGFRRHQLMAAQHIQCFCWIFADTFVNTLALAIGVTKTVETFQLCRSI
jgi:hypothetical protein